jgi:hypothetical protein
VEDRPDGGVPWLLILGGAIAALAAFAAFRKFRTVGLDEPLALHEPEAAAPVAAMPVKDPPQAETRPRLDILFKPEKAAATEAGAAVHYAIIIRNIGRSPARNVRLEARMFNAGVEQDREIGDFFRQPLQQRLAARPFDIPAGTQARLARVVGMPREEVKEIEVQGRRLFVPMVAFNALYDWGEGQTGQTSISYVVGLEAKEPSEKMGAFRLDQGPRVYRSVGQRQTRIAHIA